ncbi:hypothetical protein [Limnoglobus roseus]|uniref:Uncharacterized protein n=1 Tax=Limnoglobus roseus TaxID=2598579 RepID=A0A5C1A9W6_9BACT|nr:hypothetical protein [Limnoglobus roseus]QEL14826.1 hypothetical protein PX52LOC_01724 [Limnoglobus roseus]
MIDEALGKAITQQMHQHWIGPELEARARAGGLPADFQIRRCLVRLPVNAKAIVEFNDEIVLIAKAKVPPLTREVKKGEIVRLEDIEHIERVYPPEVDGVRVAFFYAHWVGGKFTVFFDLSPNNPEAPQEEGENWRMGEAIGSAVQGSVIELALAVHDSVQDEVLKIGLWAAPALLPHPLSRIAELVKVGDETGARKTFVDHCSPARLTELVAGWWDVPAFSDRRDLIEQALGAHIAGHYFLSVSTLIPHLEGVMTDWLHATIPDTPWKQESKTKKFRDVIAAWPDATPSFQRVAESSISFILNGPALATFKKWSDSFDTSFANRNVVGHGKFDAKLYGEENSAKLFLMLDTLAQLISAYSMRANACAPPPP